MGYEESYSRLFASDLLHVLKTAKHVLAFVQLSCLLHQGGCAHDATWQSAIFGFADSAGLRKIRKKFGHKPLPAVGARIKKRWL